MPTFADKLHEIRKERGITQEQLTREMNVSRQTISHWENGRAVPDIDTIRHLSQSLEYDFLSTEKTAEEAQPEPEQEEIPDTVEEASLEMAVAQAAPAQPPVKRRRPWGLVLCGLCVAALCLSLLPSLLKKPAAEIVITPSTTEAYLVDQEYTPGEKWIGWEVNYRIENLSDVPFTPEKLSADFYSSSRMDSNLTFDHYALRAWIVDTQLHRTDPPMEIPLGTNHTYLTHMICTIYGTDENGHQLQASTTVYYIPEYPAATLTDDPTAVKSANVRITTAENPIKARYAEDFPDGIGWLFAFRIEETNGVPFIVHELIYTLYSENGYKNSMIFTSEQLMNSWGSNTLVPNIPHTWAVGFLVPPVQRVGLVLKGTDANGNELEFTGSVELSKEIAK